jgi:solute carrier family 31 (copper transporter), member 1
MTYNGWVMIAVAVGASIGHFAFGVKTSSSKSVTCH